MISNFFCRKLHDFTPVSTLESSFHRLRGLALLSLYILQLRVSPFCLYLSAMFFMHVSHSEVPHLKCRWIARSYPRRCLEMDGHLHSSAALSLHYICWCVGSRGERDKVGSDNISDLVRNELRFLDRPAYSRLVTSVCIDITLLSVKSKVKGKVIPLQAWTGP